MTQCNEGKKDTHILPNSFLGKLAYHQSNKNKLKQVLNNLLHLFKNNALQFLLNILHMLFIKFLVIKFQIQNNIKPKKPICGVFNNILKVTSLVSTLVTERKGD